MDTTDLSSYIAGYDDYCDTSKPIYSSDDFYEMKEEFESEIEVREEKIDSLVDKLTWIKEKLEEIKNKGYVPTMEDIKYIEDIVSGDFI